MTYLNTSEATLKDTKEIAAHLNSNIRNGDLEWFLYAIKEISEANKDIEHIPQKTLDDLDLENSEIISLFNIMHKLGLRITTERETTPLFVDVNLPSSCKINPNSFRESRDGSLHTPEEIDAIVSKLDQIQYPDNEFIEYAAQFYFYRNEFYRRGDVKNDILTSTYEYYADKENVTAIHKYEIEPAIYRLVINYNQSLSDSLNNIKLFSKETEKKVREEYRKDEEDIKAATQNGQWGLMSIRNYLLDSTGRIMSDKIFRKWADYLKVYDMFKDNKSPKDISKAIDQYRENDLPNTLKYPREYREEAERLIKSAENGTFPY